MPQPVVFDLDVAENVRLREGYVAATGGRLPRALMGVPLLLQLIAPMLRLYHYHGKDPIAWAMLGLVSAVAAFWVSALVAPRWWQSLLLEPQHRTMVIFGEADIRVERDAGPRGESKRRIDFSKVRSVRLMPEALFIMGRLKPLVIVPARALPLDGAATLMTYFEERLVATRMLHRSSSRRMLITNTAYHR